MSQIYHIDDALQDKGERSEGTRRALDGFERPWWRSFPQTVVDPWLPQLQGQSNEVRLLLMVQVSPLVHTPG